MNRPVSLRFSRLVPVAAALAALLAGCHGGSSTSAQFMPSATAATPGLVKLVEQSRSGSRVVVDAVIFGPDPTLDLFAFQFGIRIQDPSLVRLVAQSSYAQTALVAGDGQVLSVFVDGTSDPSLIRVETTKRGGGPGNGVPGAALAVIELPLEVLGSGGTTLTITGLGDNPPLAIGSNFQPIAAVTFDEASATIRGVTTGGGY